MKQMPAKNTLILFLAALIWGTAFVAQQVGMDHMGPFSFSALRCTLGGLVLIPLVFLFQKFRAPEKKAQLDWKLGILGGVCCGVVLCVASNLQQIGIQYTSVGKAGFITALYIVIVPILGLFLKKPNGLKLWVSVAVAVAGLYLLCMTDSFSLSTGDFYMFLCAMIFSVHILVIDYFSPKVDGVLMSCVQFLVAGALSAVGMLIWETAPGWGQITAAWLPIVYAGVMSCGVAYTFQILGQKNVNPTIASLILSLESVISVLAGWVLLGQTMSPREITGCVLMFAAIVLAQLPERQRASVAAPLKAQEGPEES